MMPAKFQGGAGLLARAADVADTPEGAYELSRWQQWLAQQAIDATTDPKAPEAAKHEARPGGDRLEKEVFGRLYGEPDAVEKPRAEHRWLKRVHTALDQLPEFEGLRATCGGDEAWSTMAMRGIYNAACKAAPKRTKAEDNAAAARAGIGGGAGMVELGVDLDEDEMAAYFQALAEAEAEVDANADEAEDSALRHALRQAVSAAVEEVDAAQEALSTFSGGNGTGSGGGVKDERDPKKKLALAKKVKGNKDLRAIMEEAGRLRRVISAKRAQRAIHAPEELCDVELGGELSRMLPSELMGLRHPALRLNTFRKILERSALQYRLKGNETKGRGPIVVCVDESGSMSGARNTWAKGLALALLDMAQREKRGFALISFDGRVTSEFYLPPGQSQSIDTLLKAVCSFSGGGTAFEPPLDRARAIINGEVADRPNLKEADILLVTDGEASVNSQWLAKWTAWRRESGTNVYAFPIGCYESSLKTLCDKVVTLTGVKHTEDSEATDVVATI
jgi:uncharacterized protein with von Willebrand factor type A (vWA) domain